MVYVSAAVEGMVDEAVAFARPSYRQCIRKDGKRPRLKAVRGYNTMT